MRSASLKFILCCGAFAMIFSSCKKNIHTRPYWDATILAPLIQSTLSLDDLIADSLLQTNSDNSISLVFNNNIYHFAVTDQAIVIPDTTIKTNFSLTAFGLAEQTINYPYSLGQICSQLGIVGQIIIAQNGNSTNIAAINNFSTQDNPIDATTLFETATFESGFIDLTLTNNLPIELTNIVFQVRNQTDGQILTQDTFLNLLPTTAQTKTIDVSGKTVEGHLIAKILDLDTAPSVGAVLIDTSDAIIITMHAHDLVVSSATAIFPAQNLIDEDHEVQYNFSGGAELNNLKVKSGSLIVTVQSGIPEQSHFDFSLPAATDASGNPISSSIDLPPAPYNGVSEYSNTYDLSGYTINLQGISGDKHNTYYNHLIASIPGSTNVITISQSDSVNILYTLKDIVPMYVDGYVGQQIFNIGPSQTGFAAFKKIQRGTLGLENVDVNLSITNGVGVQGRMNLYKLTSTNSRTGHSVDLTWNSLGAPLEIATATDNPLIPSVTNFALNGSNSNIKSLIENLPDQLSYQLDAFINPHGNASNYHDFAYDYSAIDLGLNLTIPLSLIANDLTLMDTVPFGLGSAGAGDARIKDGTFTLITDNGYPLSTQMQLYFYDDYFEFIDSLFTGANTVEAATLDANCNVAAPTKSVLTIAINQDRMDRLRRLATHAIIVASFNTASSTACSSYIKIYSTYKLDIKLTGKFTYYTGY